MTELNCPRCRAAWPYEPVCNMNGRCPGCGTWLVVDYPLTAGKPLRLFAYDTRDRPISAITAAGIYSGDGLNGPIRVLVVECPLCGRLHSHGGGYESEPIEVALGHRTAHCWALYVPRHGNVEMRREKRGQGYTITIEDGIPVAHAGSNHE